MDRRTRVHHCRIWIDDLEGDEAEKGACQSAFDRHFNEGWSEILWVCHIICEELTRALIALMESVIFTANFINVMNFLVYPPF